MTHPDPIEWINATLRNPETGHPFDLLPAEIAFLQHCFALDDQGRALFPELTYSAPKKSGKTAFGAILVLTATLLYGGNDPEAICAANDLEQSSSRVFAAIRKIILASPSLRDKAVIMNTRITFPDLGATITAIASDAAGAAGGNPVISIGDELWGFVSESSRRLWDELVCPPTRKAAWRLVVSYAGFENESTLLQEQYRHGTAQPRIGDDLYAGEGHLTFWTHKMVAPWQDARWLAQMRRSLRPNQYTRMIENRWTISESAFIEMPLWDRCVDTGLQPLQSDRDLPVYIAVDASLKRDSTAIVAVTGDGERVRLVAHKVIQPSPDNPIDFETDIEDTVIDFCNRFSVQAVRYDPWQMAAVAQRLIKRGVPMQEFPQTSGNLTDSSSNLYELIKAENLQVYPDEAVRLAVSQAIAVETPRGWRIAKEKARHRIDAIVALAMAALAAVKQVPVPYSGLLEAMRRQSEAATVTASTAPTLIEQHGGEAIMQGWMRRQTDGLVRINVPTESSHLHINGVAYLTEIDAGRRIAWVTPMDALDLLGSASASALPFIDANRPLLEKLRERASAENYVPRNRQQGVRVVDMIQAAEDARPKSNAEFAEHFNRMKGTYANEAYRALMQARSS